MDQFNLTQNIDTLFHSIENFTQKEGIIGKPVTQGDKTFLPVISVTLGYGGGNASMGKNQTASSSTTYGSAANTGSGALGVGAKLCTDGIIVIDKDNVSMLPMNPTNASQLVDKIPQIISGMNQNKQNNMQS
ncbi:MAG: spore germination protein GerW family protein [Clostridiales bacterium]|nr:spore germination protein GerW family protein [Clostridiales bacterium]